MSFSTERRTFSTESDRVAELRQKLASVQASNNSIRKQVSDSTTTNQAKNELSGVSTRGLEQFRDLLAERAKSMHQGNDELRAEVEAQPGKVGTNENLSVVKQVLQNRLQTVQESNSKLKEIATDVKNIQEASVEDLTQKRDELLDRRRVVEEQNEKLRLILQDAGVDEKAYQQKNSFFSQQSAPHDAGVDEKAFQQKTSFFSQKSAPRDDVDERPPQKANERQNTTVTRENTVVFVNTSSGSSENDASRESRRSSASNDSRSRRVDDASRDANRAEKNYSGEKFSRNNDSGESNTSENAKEAFWKTRSFMFGAGMLAGVAASTLFRSVRDYMVEQKRIALTKEIAVLEKQVADAEKEQKELIAKIKQK